MVYLSIYLFSLQCSLYIIINIVIVALLLHVVGFVFVADVVVDVAGVVDVVVKG